MTQYLFRSCHHCGGDLYINNQYGRQDDWKCLQCGRYRYHYHKPTRPPAVNNFWAYWLAQATAAPRQLYRTNPAAADMPQGGQN